MAHLLPEIEATIRALARTSEATPHLLLALRDEARLIVAELDAAHLPRSGASA